MEHWEDVTTAIFGFVRPFFPMHAPPPSSPNSRIYPPLGLSGQLSSPTTCIFEFEHRLSIIGAPVHGHYVSIMDHGDSDRATQCHDGYAGLTTPKSKN
jgi:hypothetical protein